MEAIVIIILIVFLIIALYVIKNLLKKVELYEEDIQAKDEYIKKVTELIELGDKKLEDPEIRTAFETDDQIGDYFKKLKEVQFLLKSYTTAE